MDEILLVRINEEGQKVPYEVWDAQKAKKMSLTMVESTEIYDIMEDIQTEAYLEHTSTCWTCDFTKITEKSRNKIIKYLRSLGYEVIFISRNLETKEQKYRINW